MKKKSLIIGLDFDGTVVRHEFPEIGIGIGAVDWLYEALENDAKIVLNTMRSGNYLNDVLQWFRDRELELYGVNENPTQKEWTQSPKVYAHYYIDDCAMGVPLHYPDDGSKPFVDWEIAGPMLMKRIGVDA